MGINLLALFAPKRSSVNNQRDERQRVNVSRTNNAPLPLVSSNTQRATVAATIPLATTNVQTHTKKKAKKAENPFACTDGKDDGKLTFKEGAKHFFKGMGKAIKQTFTTPQGLILLGAGIAAVALGGGPALAAIGYAGGIYAIAGIIKNVRNLVLSGRDGYSKQEVEKLGANTLALGTSIAGMKLSKVPMKTIITLN